jgi:uncharacterized phage infection (PIP) family protein YhgE
MDLVTTIGIIGSVASIISLVISVFISVNVFKIRQTIIGDQNNSAGRDIHVSK